MIKQFEDVRQWKKIRGIGGSEDAPMKDRLQSQYQRVMQECIEIHEAIVLEDDEEFMDAIGDTIVTLINLADIKGVKAEDCLAQAFGVIDLRKGITRPTGDFVRYAKLSPEDQAICDKKQGNHGDQYFLSKDKPTLHADSFKK
jgi:NTP pyrophosphatase (non-canonical NTP hydrolase)